MANHYHLLVETPKANLSIGMRRLTGSILRVLTGATIGLAICFKAGTKRFWWKRSLISWSFAVTSCSIQRGSNAAGRRKRGNGVATGPWPDWLWCRVFSAPIGYWNNSARAGHERKSGIGSLSGRNGKSAVGRDQGADLLRKRSVHRKTRVWEE
jgi:hypothetical protein